MKYTIILSNGHVIKNADRNGQVFISEYSFSKNFFEGGLSKVTIFEDEKPFVELYEQVLCPCETGDEFREFAFADKPPEQKQQEAQTALELAIAEVYESIAGGDK